MASALTPFGRGTDLFDDFRREMDHLMGRFLERGGTPAEGPWAPTANLAETDKTYEITMDLPGMKPDQVNVELRHGDLCISGERRQEEEKGKTFHRIERHYGAFYRLIPLGDDVDPDQVDAQYKDGVLRVTVGKTEESRPRKIEVKS
jgi:HSP20 family protein